MSTPIRPPVGWRMSGSTGPVCSTTYPSNDGRSTASWVASTSVRLLPRKMASPAAIETSNQTSTSTAVRAMPRQVGRVGRGIRQR